MTRKPPPPPPPGAPPFEHMVAAYGDICGALVRWQYVTTQSAGLLGVTSMRIARERMQADEAQTLRMTHRRDAAE